MRLSLSPLLIPAAWLSLSGALFAAEWPITPDSFEIVLSSKSSPSERFAAEEIQGYLEKQSGKKIGIREGDPEEGKRAVIIGRHAANKDLWEGMDNPDHYVIDATDERIRLVGGYRPAVTDAQGREWVYDWGVLQSAYHLLDEQGVRWFRPGPEGEHAPPRETLVVENGSRKVTHSYEFRWGIAPYATSANRVTTPKEREAALLWTLRNGGNTNRGTNDPRYGGSWRMNGGHSYQYHVPQSLFATHPEFFSLIKGERVPDKQICHSNPALQDYFTESVLKVLRNSPHLRMLSIDPNDHGGWCECEGCMAWDDPNSWSGRGGGRLSMSNRVYRFNKIIAERVGKEFPHVDLYCLAYSQYTEAPTIVSDFPDNLRVGITPFHTAFSDWSRDMRDPESTQNRRVMESIHGFRKAGLKMHAREYFSFYDYYGWPGPLPMLRMMQDRLKVFREEGFDGICSETHPNWGPQGMELWMALRLIRNPDLDLEKELADYCRDYYGPAAKTMLAYHQLIEERGRDGIYYGSGGVMAHNLFTDDFLERMKPLAEQARKEAEGHEPFAKRLNAVLEGYRMARLYRNAVNAIEKGDVATAGKEVDALHHLLSEAYPDGSVFVKGLGTRRKDREGNPLGSRVVGVLRQQIARAAAVENQFPGAKLAQVLNEGWKFQPDEKDEGRAQGWYAPGFQTEGWATLRAGTPWQMQGFANHHGAAWYRRVFAGPVPKEGERMLLVFEGVDGDAEVWLNGELIGQHRLYDEQDNLQIDKVFHFDLSGHLKPNEPNDLAIRVFKETGVGGLHRSVKLLRVSADQQ